VPVPVISPSTGLWKDCPRALLLEVVVDVGHLQVLVGSKGKTTAGRRSAERSFWREEEWEVVAVMRPAVSVLVREVGVEGSCETMHPVEPSKTNLKGGSDGFSALLTTFWAAMLEVRAEEEQPDKS
jgi:hypothetical protein